MFAVELVKPIDYSPDWVELVGEHVLQEDAVLAAHGVPVPDNGTSDPAFVRIVYYGWSEAKALRPDYDHKWHSDTERYPPR